MRPQKGVIEQYRGCANIYKGDKLIRNIEFQNYVFLNGFVEFQLINGIGGGRFITVPSDKNYIIEIEIKETVKK